jgi:hypothetical protein
MDGIKEIHCQSQPFPSGAAFVDAKEKIGRATIASETSQRLYWSTEPRSLGPSRGYPKVVVAAIHQQSGKLAS